MREALLRVAAGPNIGAAVILGPGRLVIGSGEEADLILADDTLSSTHLALTVSLSEDKVYVEAEPIGGRTLLDGQPLEEGRPTSVEPGQVVSMGFSAVAWRPEGEDWGPVSLVALEYFKGALTSPESSQSPTSPNPEEGALDLPPLSPADSATEELSEENVERQAAKKKKWKKRSIIAFLFVLVLLVPLIFSWGLAEIDSQQDEVELLQKEIERAGFKNLVVTEARGGLEVEGRLNSDKDLAKLVELVKNRPLKTYLRISISADAAAAAEQTLTSYGFYPQTSVLDNGKVLVSAYMRDKTVEEEAFNRLKSDAPDIAVNRQIIYKDRLEPILSREIAGRGLEGMLETNFREGWVEILVPPEFSAPRVLSEIFMAVRKEIRCPIVYAVTRVERGENISQTSALQIAVSPAAQPEIEIVKNQQEAPSESPSETSSSSPGEVFTPIDPLASFKIIGVNLGPMRFVSTIDGHRLFEGSLLPGGWTIEHIDNQAISLSKGKETMIRPLGGAAEVGAQSK
ncbi:MAG: type III secretion system inner membrane ring subunit SctD [Deltaproteobacteria bacterium]|nr:type III secretion system inner membrane ring subunit SctD [Deltaproteobacteria bacterium]